MPLHTSDDVFVEAPAPAVHEALLHAHEDPSWWPGLRARGGYAWLELDAPTGRGDEHVRFKVRIEDARAEGGFRWIFESGPFDGHGEFWFEPFRHGTIVHYVTAIEPRAGVRAASAMRAHRWAIRRGLNGLKDRFARSR